LFFIDQYCWCKHPKLGEIRFKLFDYQSDAVLKFRHHRYVIFWKTRQCGLSTVVGAYALWYALFGCAKTVLIVSKRDDDAKEFLEKNIKFVYDRLPDWMRALWPTIVNNEHKLGFPNGSRITSLTSSPNTLRSNSASLIILDETAHMPHMDVMWASGASALVHAGQCICLGTPNGVGNWYWQTVSDAQEHLNDFELIKINWWDMKWRLEHKDPITGQKTVIAPTAGIREAQTPEERRRYGKFVSPWLEGQYRLLTERGDDKKFRQETLALFLGSGNTVLSTDALNLVHDQHVSEHLEVGDVDYVNPSTGVRDTLSFDRKLWIWQKPVRGTTRVKQSVLRAARDIHLLPAMNKVEKGEEPHVYVGGVDTSEGDGSDFAAIEIFDVTAQEQVCELKIKVQPAVLARMADYLGRYYNDAMLVVDSTGIGRATVLNLEELCYPNLWRPRKVAGKLGPPGFKISPSSKPLINKALLEQVGQEDGYRVASFRLFKELCIYVHLTGGKTGNERGTGNNDDLVTAAGLALLGASDAVSASTGAMPPYKPLEDPRAIASMTPPDEQAQRKMAAIVEQAGPCALSPYTPIQSAAAPCVEDELGRFVRQIGGVPVVGGKPLDVVSRRYVLPAVHHRAPK
jgi:hypothetical protein